MSDIFYIIVIYLVIKCWYLRSDIDALERDVKRLKDDLRRLK